MAMASLNASLLARKGSARPVTLTPKLYENNTQTIEAQPSFEKTSSWPAVSTQLNAKNTPLDKRRSCKKSMRLSKATDKDLRLLAASLGTSQQALMEQAVTVFLKNAYRDRGCICGAR